MQSNPYQQQPYGYPQQGYQQQQTGRNYQTGLASPGYPQYGQSYAQGLAGNAAYQDENDIYNVNIPSAFERLKALRKTNPRRKPVIVKPKPRPAPKVNLIIVLLFTLYFKCTQPKMLALLLTSRYQDAFHGLS